MEDGKRIQRVLDEISAKYADRKNGQQPIVMEEKAKQMLADYANELAASVLEAASMLADHRNSKTIDVEDVNLILSTRPHNIYSFVQFSPLTNPSFYVRALITEKKLGIDLTAFSNLKQQQATEGSVAKAETVVKPEPSVAT